MNEEASDVIDDITKARRTERYSIYWEYGELRWIEVELRDETSSNGIGRDQRMIKERESKNSEK